MRDWNAASRMTLTFLLAALPLAACGGGGSTSGTTVVTAVTPTPAPASPTPTPTPATPAGVADFTTLNLAALDNYAAPALPPYYDATVRADDNTPAGNAITDRIATLGRVLFYDRRLSTNDTTSCASCHQQASAFTDPRRFSTGISGSAFTSAHAMRLGNVRYYAPGTMFWDKRAASIEAQASVPIQNVVEMGWDAAAGGLPALIAKMNATTYYPDLFTFAFGTSTISEARIQQAIAQFERAMISSGSRWDTGYATVFSATAPNRNLGVDLPNLTAQENRGRTLFIGGPGVGLGCAGCHAPPTFALVANSQSNGLDAGETRIFKAPSLKSVGVTGPYMHDGRFATLADVIEFYDHVVQNGPALDNRLKQGAGPRVLNLPAADKAALVAFLLTLNDTALVADARFSNPFRK